MTPSPKTYQDCDENGLPLDVSGRYQRPKWQQTTSDFQRELLAVFNMRYFPSKDLRHEIFLIEKGMVEFGGKCKYPRAWINQQIKYVQDQRLAGKLINIKGLITLITNEGKLQEWKEKQGFANPDGSSIAARSYTLRADIAREVENYGMETDDTDALT